MTIISTDRKLIFVHLHKCGGTSVEQAYETVSLYNDVLVGSTELGESIQSYYSTKFSIEKHSDAQSIARVIGPIRWADYQSFALVRNPYSIYESFFRWIAGIFRYHAERKGCDVAEMKERVSVKRSGLNFENWGASQAFAATDGFNGFIEYCIRYQKLPQQSLVSRLCLLGGGGVKNVFKLEDIEDFWLAFESCVGIQLPRFHANKGSVKQNLTWERSHVVYLAALFKEDLLRFDYAPPSC